MRTNSPPNGLASTTGRSPRPPLRGAVSKRSERSPSPPPHRHQTAGNGGPSQPDREVVLLQGQLVNVLLGPGGGLGVERALDVVALVAEHLADAHHTDGPATGRRANRRRNRLLSQPCY